MSAQLTVGGEPITLAIDPVGVPVQFHEPGIFAAIAAARQRGAVGPLVVWWSFLDHAFRAKPKDDLLPYSQIDGLFLHYSEGSM